MTSFLICFNAHNESLAFTLPDAAFGTRWHRVIDTADPDLRQPVGPLESSGILDVFDRAIVVLQLSELDDGFPASGIALADS